MASSNIDFNCDEEKEYIEEKESTLLQKQACDLDQIYNMYNDYSFLHGFSIKRSTSQLSGKDKSIRSKKFTCCKEGQKAKVKEGEKHRNPKYVKHDVRTNCKAHIVAKPDIHGQKWEITRHDMVHNHPFANLEETHLLLSHKDISKEHIEMLQNMVKSGIRVADAYKYLRHQAKGSPMLGFSLKDAYNELERKKKLFCAAGDAQSLIRILEDAQNEDPEFFFRYKLDQSNKLESVFWRDRLMKGDYLTFGDLLVFDTTFKTNKYALACAPFVCMNHHNKNVLVGCSFVRSETISSFKWLFEVFKEAMDGKEPATIMTDQDAAMHNAIGQCFTNSRHRLCTWHIGQNSMKHLSQYYLQKGFSDMFDHILRRCYTELEFETNWISLQDIYGVGKNQWLENLYSIRKKVSNAYNSDVFSGGALASQRSESTNSVIAKRRRTTNGLVDCYFLFCDMIKEWRRNERDDNLNDKLKYPTVAIPDSGILNQAKKIYTISAYQLFELQFKKSFGCKHFLRETVEGLPGQRGYIYDVYQKRLPQLRDSKVTVLFREFDSLVQCECNRLYSGGMLCCHALRILNVHNVDKLQEPFFHRRWTRQARPQVHKNADECTDEENEIQQKKWQMQLQRKINKILGASRMNNATRKICEDGFIDIIHKVELMIGTLDLEDKEKVGAEEEEEETTETTHESILNPVVKRKIGERTERHKSITEKVGRKKIRTKKSDTPDQQNQKKTQATKKVGDSNNQTSSMADGRDLHIQLTTMEPQQPGYDSTQIGESSREVVQDCDTNEQASSIGQGTQYSREDNHPTTIQADYNSEELGPNSSEVAQVGNTNLQNSNIGDGVSMQFQNTGKEVYIPRFERTDYSQFEGGPSSSGVGDLAMNMSDMEFLICEGQGTRNDGSTPNERFVDFFSK